MAVTININGLSLCHKASGGVAIATVPDVCKTPTPGGPVPIPYPNVAYSKKLAKGTKTIKVDGGNMAANKGSEFSTSIGDEPGTLGGVKSGTHKKEATWLTYSFDVKFEGKGACRLTDKMLMNHGNTFCMEGEIQPPLIEMLIKLCAIFCACNNKGNQSCVKKMLDAEKGQLKAEVPYDMTQMPPEELPEYWFREGSPDFRPDLLGKKGSRGSIPLPKGGMKTIPIVRRPDVAILNDPNGPARGSNLSALVEMKFPTDRTHPETSLIGRAQMEDYYLIAKTNDPPADIYLLDEEICCKPIKEPVPVYVPESVPSKKRAPIYEYLSETNWGKVLEGATGLGLMVGGAAISFISSAATGLLLADNVSGVGVLDDPLVPVAAAGVGLGAGTAVKGYQMWLNAWGF